MTSVTDDNRRGTPNAAPVTPRLTSIAGSLFNSVRRSVVSSAKSAVRQPPGNVLTRHRTTSSSVTPATKSFEPPRVITPPQRYHDSTDVASVQEYNAEISNCRDRLFLNETNSRNPTTLIQEEVRRETETNIDQLENELKEVTSPTGPTVIPPTPLLAWETQLDFDLLCYTERYVNSL